MKQLPLFCFLLLAFVAGTSQPVTGVWIGRVTRGTGLARQTYKLEVKMIKTGDSIVGTSYYYASGANYFRYAIKGYFSAVDNSVNWWDDQLLDSKTSGLRIGGLNQQPLTASADYNCPGSGIMKLDGKASAKEGGTDNAMEIHLDKHANPVFRDEWDPIIEDYFYGAADPAIIDSVGRIALARRTPAIPPAAPSLGPVIAAARKPVITAPDPVIAAAPPTPPPSQPAPAPGPVIAAAPDPVKTAPEPVIAAAPATPPPSQPAPQPRVPAAVSRQPSVAVSKPVVEASPRSLPAPATAYVPGIEDKFITRKNNFTAEIPITADSIEFRFYDNAEVDGDSISVFLNRQLIDTHVRLTEKAYIIKIATAALGATNELVMVAENLGSIPPNTAYMEAWSGTNRFTARLESTENSSAMIRLVRK